MIEHGKLSDQSATRSLLAILRQARVQGLAFAPRLTKLTRLDLDRTNVTDAGMVHLGNMVQLENKGLTNINVSDVGP